VTFLAVIFDMAQQFHFQDIASRSHGTDLQRLIFAGLRAFK